MDDDDQTRLFEERVDRLYPEERFDGATYEPPLDAERLGTQAKAVFRAMSEPRWWTLRELSDRTGYPEASVSARLRDFRKRRFGGWEVERRRIGGGLFAYRLREGGASDEG